MNSWLSRMVRNEIYDSSAWTEFPHVVKFSGGRSSGMLLKLFLDKNWLNAERGDVIVFNNTSAEHPATYEFARKCADYAESQKGIPFFWIEFATYEDAFGGDWTRSPTFRLVNKNPVSESNPSGYHWRGEVFEELVSHQGFLPSRTTRTCTAHLKLETTSRFLSEWFAFKRETLRRGHFYNSSQVTDDSLIRRHREARGKLSEAEVVKRKKFVRSQPFVREAQDFGKFTNAPVKHIANAEISNKSLGDYTTTDGPRAIQFLSLIGLRNDERSRVYKVMARNHSARDGQTRKATYMLDGEIIVTPLNKLRVSRQDVCDYWSSQDWDLAIPNDANLSNCVFCFNKGSSELARISRRIASIDEKLAPKLRSVQDTPTDIDWWVDLESKYIRVAKNRKKTAVDAEVKIGMWGVDSVTSYETIRDTDPSDLIAREPSNAIPCDCTD